jgi:hypothetical protein
MLLIPEKELILILPPRTGSGSLYRAVRAKFPRAILLYRHMEADGVPFGYDIWQKYCVIRHPLVRLWSLYHFLKHFAGGSVTEINAKEQALDSHARIHASVARPFEDWMLHNEMCFTGAEFTYRGELKYPILRRHHLVPENKASLWLWARPDLGTKLVHFEHLAEWCQTKLDMELLPAIANKSTRPAELPVCTPAMWEHLQHFFSWDLQQCCNPSA